MKKVIILLIAIMIVSGVILIISKGLFLMKSNGFKIYSNAGNRISGKLYIENDNVDSMVYLLILDKSLSFKSDNRLLIIDMKSKFIGIPELSSGEIINLPGRYAFQRKRHPNVIGAIGTEFFFDEKILDYAIFNGNKIIFNTSGPLKQYGDSIILDLGKH